MIKIIGFLFLSLLAFTAFAEQEVSLADFCGNNKPIKLNKISQVNNLISKLLSTDQTNSCKKYSNSLIKLKPILDIVETGQSCDLKLTDKIRDYHYEFINGRDKLAENDEIPQSLRVFFISLCFQISAECKMSLITNLEYDTKELLTEEDYKIIDTLERHGATLLDTETKINDFDDILLLNDINSALNDSKGNQQQEQKEEEDEDGEQQLGTRLMIKVKTNMMLKELIKTCNNKFKPFYEKLILPLCALSNLGYNYQGEILAKELKELKEGELIRRWYNIVQTCEAFSAVEVFEDDETILDNQQAITLITPEEAASLRAKQGVGKDSDSFSDALKYDPEPLDSVDALWIQNQAELENLVNKYKASATESERIKRRLMKKLFEKLKTAMKSGKFGVFVSDLVAGKSKSTTNINGDMLTIMDDAIDKSESTKIINLQDSPVAYGNRNYGVSSKVPPRKPNYTSYVPPKIVAINAPEDQSTIGSKIFNGTLGKLLPAKLDIFFWFLGIIGVLMIILGILMAG